MVSPTLDPLLSDQELRCDGGGSGTIGSSRDRSRSCDSSETAPTLHVPSTSLPPRASFAAGDATAAQCNRESMPLWRAHDSGENKYPDNRRRFASSLPPRHSSSSPPPPQSISDVLDRALVICQEMEGLMRMHQATRVERRDQLRVAAAEDSSPDNSQAEARAAKQ